MPRRGYHTLDEQFPLKPLAEHHDLDTWDFRSEAALQRHWSDLAHVDRMRRLMGMDPLARTERPSFAQLPGQPQPVTHDLGPVSVQVKPVQQDMSVPPAPVEGQLPAQSLPSMRGR